jgi:hypothetical protein
MAGHARNFVSAPSLKYMAGVNPSAHALAGHQLARLQIPLDCCGASDIDEAGARTVRTVAYSAEPAGIHCRETCEFFRDNVFCVGFGPHCNDEPRATFGHICCIENSTGTDGGVEISIDADGLVPVLLGGPLLRLVWPPAGEPYEPYADVRIWFPIFARDGAHGERLIHNLLHEPGRPLIRVEVWQLRPADLS